METSKAQNNTGQQKTLQGKVVSDKMMDTVVVEVTRFIKHPKYKKYYKVSKKIKADDKGNSKKMGDVVNIVSTRPISKDKHFKVL